MRIPQSVLNESQELVDLYGERIRYIGKCGKKEVYLFEMPDEEFTGYPFIYLYDHEADETEEITGFKALDIIQELSGE